MASNEPQRPAMPDEEPITADVVPDPFEIGAGSVAGSRTPSGSAYSLLLLFYLTTLAAILTAACRLALSNELWTLNAFFQAWIVIGLFCTFISGIITCYNRLSASNLMLGVLSAVVVGLIAAFIILVSPAQFTTLALIIPIGCWLIILLASVA